MQGRTCSEYRQTVGCLKDGHVVAFGPETPADQVPIVGTFLWITKFDLNNSRSKFWMCKDGPEECVQSLWSLEEPVGEILIKIRESDPTDSPRCQAETVECLLVLYPRDDILDELIGRVVD